MPDVMILEPRGKFHGLFIELKVKYNKPSDTQELWIDLLNKRGYSAMWTNSLDEAISTIDKYLRL